MESRYTVHELDVSTQHVADTSREWLSRNCETLHYGWFFSVWALPGNVPPDIQDIVNRAVEKGCTYVLLDRNAAIHEGLKTYEWKEK